MELQQLIKQSKFVSSNQKALINLIYTHHFLESRQNYLFKKNKILAQHFNILKIIKGKYPDPVTPKYILDVMLDKGRDLTRLIDKLVNKGYLYRAVDPNNKRSIQIHMTESGLFFIKNVEVEVNDWLTKNSYLTDEEAEELSRLLDKMRGV